MLKTCICNAVLHVACSAMLSKSFKWSASQSCQSRGMSCVSGSHVTDSLGFLSSAVELLESIHDERHQVSAAVHARLALKANQHA